MTSQPTRGRAAVVVVSTQASADPALDRTGPVIASWLRERAFTVPEPVIVPDGGPVAETVSAELLSDARVVITTGGTGVTPTDRTPEAIAPLIDLELPGITEEIRRRGLAGAGPTALLSRGIAGIAGGGTLVVTLPGSRGGVADGLAVLDGLLDHVLAQVSGEGHAPRSAS
ncbi:molybdopterin-binding protein [Curtobacterium sp. A7_M15]|jgi:molybdenum cofactor synthesis domain-containing protein|uniref:molybdopterin-binding protein n=1 Tax=Curtobacterium sp. A7_M15 TaxID=3065241 RepID=UPI002737CCBE|nr:molybdopterin-binding protein [Curtobacterium sp. A7_M15]MDP4332638.1 molybdopterin-binding protein [Curtobacterium sp. A7_M15]